MPGSKEKIKQLESRSEMISDETKEDLNKRVAISIDIQSSSEGEQKDYELLFDKKFLPDSNLIQLEEKLKELHGLKSLNDSKVRASSTYRIYFNEDDREKRLYDAIRKQKKIKELKKSMKKTACSVIISNAYLLIYFYSCEKSRDRNIKVNESSQENSGS
jgi:hypothetical protein